MGIWIVVKLVSPFLLVLLCPRISASPRMGPVLLPNLIDLILEAKS